MADHIDKGIRKILEISSVYTFYQNLVYPRSAHLRYIKDFVQPFPGAKIMDIGCGPGTVVDYLTEVTPEVDYIGYDFNEQYIREAQQKYGDKGTFVCKRVSHVDADEADKYDIVMANAILHHLNDEEAEHLYATALHALKPGGHLVTFDPVFIPKQNAFAKWIIKKDRGQNTRTEQEHLRLAGKYFSDNQTFIDHKFLRMPYTIIIGKHYKRSNR
jgi:trans-aconitate methyltransferase